jgi:hypothetical protein
MFVINLCDIIIEEEKYFAIPYILRISKFKNFIDYFRRFAESQESSYMKMNQFVKIKEDKVLIPKQENKQPQEEEMYITVLYDKEN